MRDWLTKNENLIIAAILLINVLPKIFYFSDRNLFIDGDEAIFGTMVRELLSNGHLSLFFYGQNYNFVFFEVLLSAGFSYFFGLNIIVLKISMFLFWLVDLVVLYYLSKKLFNSWAWSLLTILGVSFIPVWFDWSTKARGGYLTALLLSNLIILLSLSKKNLGRIILISLSLLFIYYAQPLWLIILIPFIFNYLFYSFRLKYFLYFAASLIFSFISFSLLLNVLALTHETPKRLGLDQVFFNLKNLAYYYSVAYSGNFFDAVAAKFTNLALINSLIFLSLFGLALAGSFYLLLIKKINKEHCLFFLASIFYLIFITLANEPEFSYRYLLPIYIPSIILIVFAAKNIVSRIWRRAVFVFLLVYLLFTATLIIFTPKHIFPPIRDNYSEVARIKILDDFLQTQNVSCAYTLDWLLSWQLNYFTPALKTRSQEIDPRKTTEVFRVDELQASENNCALLGFWYHLPLYTKLYGLQDIIVISNRYLVYLKPQKIDLLKLNFQLTN